MRLLLDENLSRRIVPFLQEAYPDSTQIALLGMETAPDLEVWTFAREQDYIIVSKDSDFYDLSLVMGVPATGNLDSNRQCYQERNYSPAHSKSGKTRILFL